MRPPAMIAVEIAGQHSLQLAIVQHDDTIQRRVPDNEHLFNTRAFNALLELAPINTTLVP
jgi:hypothetical protein